MPIVKPEIRTPAAPAIDVKSDTLFSGALAKVVFGTTRASADSLVSAETTRRLTEFFTQADLAELMDLAPYIDRVLITQLPGAHQAMVGAILMGRDPRLIDQMPTLAAKQSHLANAWDLAQVFEPRNLRALCAAIDAECAAASGGGIQS